MTATELLPNGTDRAVQCTNWLYLKRWVCVNETYGFTTFGVSRRVPPTKRQAFGLPSFLQAKKRDRLRYNLVYRKTTSPRKLHSALRTSHSALNLPLAISNLPFCEASGSWHLASTFRTPHSAFRIYRTQSHVPYSVLSDFINTSLKRWFIL